MQWSTIQTKLLLSFYISFIYIVLVAFSSTINMTIHIYIILERFVLKTLLPISHLGATTLSITSFRLMTLSIKGLFATLSIMAFSINDTQHNSTLGVIMLNVSFCLC